MRASPACQVSLQRIGAWRFGVCALVAAASAVITAWAWSRDSSPAAIVLWPTLAFTLVLMAAAATSLWRLPQRSLHWDGNGWHLDEIAGDLSVAIDLGPWMLLVFVPGIETKRPGEKSIARPGRVSWLPFQRRGLERQWHALRCAVYSPRPVADKAR